MFRELHNTSARHALPITSHGYYGNLRNHCARHFDLHDVFFGAQAARIDSEHGRCGVPPRRLDEQRESLPHPVLYGAARDVRSPTCLVADAKFKLKGDGSFSSSPLISSLFLHFF